MVEVKGTWANASSSGVELTGREVLIGTQHGRDFWLYVVDNCQNGTGNIFGVYQDPIRIFHDALAGAANVRVPGSALTAARDINGEPR